ncbi:hypothetical protein T03_17097 [Trichinella britovi]|uniref:Uncharacterized protein n=1 Tax=Trichinella britovi TaxID=45882 RepID=A0A0V0ZUP0_TRIBR|nr:hypothetical protein T03_17097 [Trichinella britovi]
MKSPGELTDQNLGVLHPAGNTKDEADRYRVSSVLRT